jgi:hypothetical protein
LGEFGALLADPYFYCGFGYYDDPSNQPLGVCCPVGWRSYFNLYYNKWECQESAQCGIPPIINASCDFDFDTQTQQWYSSYYQGDENDWCNVQIPNVYHSSDLPNNYNGTTGCCLIPKFGQINYWVDKNNINIWG